MPKIAKGFLINGGFLYRGVAYRWVGVRVPPLVFHVYLLPVVLASRCFSVTLFPGPATWVRRRARGSGLPHPLFRVVHSKKPGFSPWRNGVGVLPVGPPYGYNNGMN